MIWNPWHGCHRYSEGCLHCYIHKGDYKRNVDTSIITKTKDFDKPIQKKKNGEYRMKSGVVYLCFSSDFFIVEADKWRKECWKMIRERSDCEFIFLTKRIERIAECLPEDIEEGYDNVHLYCTVENQRTANIRLPILKKAPFVHKGLTMQPLLENVDIEEYLDDIEEVIVGGESDYMARPLNYDWVLNIREQCKRHKTDFIFRQLGTHFIKDGKMYKLKTRDLMSQAAKANINLKF